MAFPRVSLAPESLAEIARVMVENVMKLKSGVPFLERTVL